MRHYGRTSWLIIPWLQKIFCSFNQLPVGLQVQIHYVKIVWPQQNWAPSISTLFQSNPSCPIHLPTTNVESDWGWIIPMNKRQQIQASCHSPMVLLKDSPFVSRVC